MDPISTIPSATPSRSMTRSPSPRPLPQPQHSNRNTERGINHPRELDDLLLKRNVASSENISSPFYQPHSASSNFALQGHFLLKVSKKGVKKVHIMIDATQSTLSYTHTNGKTRQIPIDDIDHVRCEDDVDQYRAELPEKTIINTKGWFTLICSVPEKSKPKMVHLLADSVEDMKAWTMELSSIMRRRERNIRSLMSFDKDTITELWADAMAIAKGDSEPTDFVLTHDTFDQLCQTMHINASRQQLLAIFKACCKDSKGLSYMQFCELLSMIREQSPINTVYHEVIGKRGPVDGKPDDGKVGLTCQEFLDFLEDVQGEDVHSNHDYWTSIFHIFSTFDRKTNSYRVTQVNMFEYLRSEYNPPLKKKQEHIKLDEPMSRYFISSSHNTYLLGRQIAGSSSVEGYILALLGGCRCVEIDCWDGPNGEPQVLHGRTLTSAVPFHSCITAINRWAFAKSEYPLWISLEVHTDPSQQARMVEIMKTTFGSKLVTETLDSHPTELPSPEELKGRILIKVKKPLSKDESKQTQEPRNRRRGNSLTSGVPPPLPYDAAASPFHSSPPSPVLRPFPRAKTLPLRSADLLLLAGQDSDVELSPTKTEKVLGDLGVYCTGVKFREFDAPEAKAFNHIFSFKEDSFHKCSRTKELKNSLELHNRNYLMRVYPNQLRVLSNNFDPLIYWRRGVQMAALNWQTFDLGMQLNRAMFAGGNDSTGYVLKPSLLRQEKALEGPIGPGHYQRKEISLQLSVVSAQQLVCPSGVRSMNPYVEVEVFHASDPRYKTNADNTVKEDMVVTAKYRTRIMVDNGYNPAFNANFHIDLTTRHEDLVFLRFSVKLSPDGVNYPAKDPAPIATYMVKLVNLNQGYRFMPLWDRKGAQLLFSNLLCYAKLNYLRPVMVAAAQTGPESQSKLRSISDMVFGRAGSANTSPRSTIEKE
ncbi:hypothetical protein TD95_005323 [Thielaviopsis punctulata]|uniref:Phosphoinositide phospholipase C n=1 Tax=Thielaviopsis punctulata TaxID=72032 RepID=A0A0F4ZK86_9PEZI|nr:hypothetical protein TD95_005323 [Thielaviopsis punctulata]